MELIRETTEFILERSSAAAIGKFDGIHRGHRRLLDEILAQKQNGLLAAVFTFDPPPQVFFGRGGCGELMTREEKRRLFWELGVDVLIEFPLWEETAAMPPEIFIEKILARQMRASYIAAGTDISFGSRGAGDAKMLKAYGESLGFTVQIIEKVCEGGREISSSRIREEIKQGRMEEAAKLTGRPYRISGTVRHGKRLGRSLGMPTVNLELPERKLLPPNGVYFSRVEIGGGQYRGISNIGCKPTVSDEGRMGLETYLYDFDGDLYDREVGVSLLHFWRPEMRFDTVELLADQMRKDIEAGKYYL